MTEYASLSKYLSKNVQVVIQVVNNKKVMAKPPQEANLYGNWCVRKGLMKGEHALRSIPWLTRVSKLNRDRLQRRRAVLGRNKKSDWGKHLFTSKRTGRIFVSRNVVQNWKSHNVKSTSRNSLHVEWQKQHKKLLGRLDRLFNFFISGIENRSKGTLFFTFSCISLLQSRTCFIVVISEITALIASFQLKVELSIVFNDFHSIPTDSLSVTRSISAGFTPIRRLWAKTSSLFHRSSTLSLGSVVLPRDQKPWGLAESGRDVP